MSVLTEKDLEIRDRLYDRLICGEDWEELAEVLDGHMPLEIARLAAFAYCRKGFYGDPVADDLIDQSNRKVAEIIEEYIRNWKPAEREPTESEIMEYEEKHR